LERRSRQRRPLWPRAALAGSLRGSAYIAVLAWISVAGLLTEAAEIAGKKEELVAKPPTPAIQSLKLEPSSLTLDDGRDSRRVLVWGETDGKGRVDLTSEAVLKAGSAGVEVDAEGYIHGKTKGTAEVVVTAGGKEIKLPVTVKNADLPVVGFVRDVEPILSRVGCNQGTCHGSANGKNGFKLSLRGYDPEYDYDALINDLSGRRFNRVAVDQSLMLLKPTGEVPHEGRQAIQPGSRYYHLLRQWIAEGTKYEDPAKTRVQRLEVFPADVELDLPGRAQQLLVLAHYPDGSTREVTREVIFSSNNTEVARVKDGLVTGLRRGEAAVLVKYEGVYATKEVTVMGDRTGFAWSNPPEYNFIDKHVNTKLQRVRTLPSGLCTDEEFLRRVYLDLTGQPPGADKVRAFIKDESDSRAKRAKLVDDLLASPDYVKAWANKWADLLQCNSENLGQKGVWVFRDWIRQSIEQNKPYDQFVRELILAEGSSYRNPAVNYYRALREPGKIAEDVSQTFLGTRFNCNKCHDHPFEKWTQNQYYEFGAYFARVAIKRGTLGSDVINGFTGYQQTVAGEEIVYRNYNGGEVKHPKNARDMKPKVPYGEANAATGDGDRREAFAAWLTSKENPLFAKSMANRTWSYFFGRGIIDPVDDIRGSNPPSNAALLDALTEQFVADKFDTRKLMRLICNSRTYQLSIIRNQWNEDDKINFSHATPRRLSAEQMLDAIDVATGTRPKVGPMPAGMRSVEAPDGLVAGNDFLALFGRPKRQSACECERTSNVTLSHAMNLINGSTIGDAVQSGDNRVKKIVEAESDDHKVVEEIYLSVLNRFPTAKETAAIDFKAGGTRLEVAQDLTWALLNSPAFLFNR
jgi:hypothetical protein